jgi:hypothetical protein
MRRCDRVRAVADCRLRSERVSVCMQAAAPADLTLAAQAVARAPAPRCVSSTNRPFPACRSWPGPAASVRCVQLLRARGQERGVAPAARQAMRAPARLHAQRDSHPTRRASGSPTPEPADRALEEEGGRHAYECALAGLRPSVRLPAHGRSRPRAGILTPSRKKALAAGPTSSSKKRIGFSIFNGVPRRRVAPRAGVCGLRGARQASS